MMKNLIAAIFALLSSLAHAECEPPGRPLRVELPPALVDARYKDYLRMCEQFGGTLLDGQATHLGKKFVSSKGVYKDPLPKAERKRDGEPLKGTAFVGVVIDEKGKTIAVSLIGTSGNEAMDAHALKTMKRTHYTWPAKLEKKPVRTYEAFLVFPVDCPTCDA
jgi:TonB family protein